MCVVVIEEDGFCMAPRRSEYASTVIGVDNDDDDELEPTCSSSSAKEEWTESVSSLDALEDLSHFRSVLRST